MLELKKLKVLHGVPSGVIFSFIIEVSIVHFQKIKATHTYDWHEELVVGQRVAQIHAGVEAEGIPGVKIGLSPKSEIGNSVKVGVKTEEGVGVLLIGWDLGGDRGGGEPVGQSE